MIGEIFVLQGIGTLGECLRNNKAMLTFRTNCQLNKLANRPCDDTKYRRKRKEGK